ncbi:uncharacterized protein [Triticum aestivum]|uniref:uncharacterized protein n=1 Tax=Triticum aestivum TaxID=4565 RepID=UPI001D019AB1|nr:uncharacterized protein LOC123125810 [Triticum aestivum]
MFVFMRQPWSMGSDNLLIEFMDPEDHNKDIQDYKFDTIFVTVRIYGVPPRFRSQQLLQKLLGTLGQVSEFHPFSQAMLYAKSDYMWGTIKMAVASPVQDKIWVSFPTNLAGWVYLFYERIGRICTFCGVMFHTVQHCPTRNNLLISRQRLHIELDQIPSERLGQWMNNAELIPMQSAIATQEHEAVFSTFLNPQLIRLQKQSMEDVKGKANVPTEEECAEVVPKELSLRKINMQIQMMQQGNSSKDAGQQQVQERVSASHLLRSTVHGQSGEHSSLPPATLPTAVNSETGIGRCINAGDRAHLPTSLSVPALSGDANQSGPLSQFLMSPPCAPGQEL